MQTTTVIWIELTSPWEENLTKKHFEKMDKYSKLAIDLREGRLTCEKETPRGEVDSGPSVH